MEQPRIRLETHLWRNGRGLPALSPDAARLDDRALADMAAFLVRYFRQIPIDETRRWDAMLIGDPAIHASGDITFLLAEIAATAPKREYVESRRGVALAGRNDVRKGLVANALRRLDSWYRRLATMRSLLGSSTCLEAFWIDFTAILGRGNTSSIPDLPLLVSSLRNDSAWRAELDGMALHPVWTVALHPAPMPDLVQLHSALTSATEALVAKARTYLDRSMTEITDHPPHTALLLAFIQMTGHVQAKLNRITGRHLDFYFRTMLRLAPRPATSDVATVTLDLSPQSRPFHCPSGTHLSAGNDARGQPILFATDHGLDVTHAQVRSIKAVRLRMATDPSRPGEASCIDEVAEINAYPVADSHDGYGAPIGEADVGWSTFGAARGPSPSLVGISIRSSILQLSEGQRTIDIVMRFLDPHGLETAVNAYLERVGSPSRTVEMRLGRCFTVMVSTAKGFVRMSHETIFHPARGSLRFTISVPSTCPAITASDGLACVRILLDPTAPVYGYTFFRQVGLRTVAIKVAAKGLANLTVNGAALAPIEASKPIAPFGSPALRGASLMLGHPDLAGKAVTQVAIAMRWSNLPEGTDGLDRHYATYGLGTTAASFRLTVSTLVGQSWMPLRTGDVPMFTTDGTTLRGEMRWTFPTRDHWTDAATRAATPTIVRMMLSAPDYGFGQTIYPTVLSRVLMTQATQGPVGPPTLPNPPFVPLIDSLTLDFHATVTLAADDSRMETSPSTTAGLYLFDAFGLEAPLLHDALLPPYPAQGYLFIGLSGLADASSLSLFVNIEPRAADIVAGGTAIDAKARRKSLQICCLSADRWIALTDDNILSDSTEALVRPGLLNLQPPRIEASRGRTFDPTLVWLRIVAEGNPDTYGRTIGIACNGVAATRIVSTTDDPIATAAILPAGSITKVVGGNARLTTVRQDRPTLGGTAEETEQDFRIRVAERLRHKSRAILSHDYEAMVLERFPSIGDVKCFGGPGSVTVVVAPLRHEGVALSRPVVPEYELQAILDHLGARSSSCICRLIVRNPTFEPVRAIAWLRLSAGDTNAKIRSVRATIDRFIAPWVGRPALPMAIGAPHIDLAGLRAVVGTLPFVTYMTGLSVTHLHGRPRQAIGIPSTEAESLAFSLDDSARRTGAPVHVRPASPHSVLVPAHHHLRIIGALGIGHGVIDDDFLVGSESGSGPAPSFSRAPRRAGIGNLRIEDDFLVPARQADPSPQARERQAR